MNYPMHHQLIHHLRELGHILRYLSDGKGSQSRILTILLAQNKPVVQRDLIKRLGIQPGSASEVLSKLEKSGWITRTTSSQDHRLVNLELSASGIEEAQIRQKEMQAREADMFSSLTSEQKQTLLELLDILWQDWQKRYEKKESSGHV